MSLRLRLKGQRSKAQRQHIVLCLCVPVQLTNQRRNFHALMMSAMMTTIAYQTICS